MKRFARMLFAGLGIVIAGSAISLVPHQAVSAGPVAPVIVTNTSLPVTQSGPWNVGITGTPTVNANITNQLPLPVAGRVSVDNFPFSQQVTLAPTSILNLGRLPSQQVILFANSTSSAVCPGWINAQTSQCFSGIPTASVLVITDVDWSANAIVSSPPLSGHACDLTFRPTAGGFRMFLSSGDSNADGYISKSEHLAGGFFVDPAVQGPLAPSWTISGSGCGIGEVILRGYLVPNQ